MLEFQTRMAGVLHFRCETYLPGQLCHGLILTQAKISHKQQVLKYLARVRPLIASNIVKDQQKTSRTLISNKPQTTFNLEAMERRAVLQHNIDNLGNCSQATSRINPRYGCNPQEKTVYFVTQTLIRSFQPVL